METAMQPDCCRAPQALTVKKASKKAYNNSTQQWRNETQGCSHTHHTVPTPEEQHGCVGGLLCCENPEQVSTLGYTNTKSMKSVEPALWDGNCRGVCAGNGTKIVAPENHYQPIMATAMRAACDRKTWTLGQYKTANVRIGVFWFCPLSLVCKRY